MTLQMCKHLVTVGNKNSLLAGRNVWNLLWLDDWIRGGRQDNPDPHPVEAKVNSN